MNSLFIAVDFEYSNIGVSCLALAVKVPPCSHSEQFGRWVTQVHYDVGGARASRSVFLCSYKSLKRNNDIYTVYEMHIFVI